MDRIGRYIGQILFRSTFGVTLLTVAAMILILTFLLKGTHPGAIPEGADDDEQVAGEASQSPEAVRNRAAGEQATSPTRVKPSDRYAANRGSVPPSMTPPKYIARLIRTCDCQWAENADAPRDGAPLMVGQTLCVSAGLAEIAFACGAKAILEGPAELQLQSEKSSSLRTGRLTADVPDEVEGFTVHTPVAQVVSLCSVASKPLARLTSTADCRWAEGSAVTKEGAALKSGQKVKLESGLAQLTFACGAKVILQGPGVLEIESAKTAILHSGKLTADVPDDLEGFKIRTAVVEVIALPADPKATKDKSNAPKSPAAKSGGEERVVVLKAGEHARIEAPTPASSSKVTPPAPAPRQSTLPAPRPSRTSAT
jgi:hypothetical protein